MANWQPIESAPKDYRWLPEDWEHPEWGVYNRVHNWRNYVSEQLKGMWETFTEPQKRELAKVFQDLADSEQWD